MIPEMCNIYAFIIPQCCRSVKCSRRKMIGFIIIIRQSDNLTILPCSQKPFSPFTDCSRGMRIFFSFMMYTIVKVQGTLFQIPQIPQSPFLSCFLFFGYVKLLHIALTFLGRILLFKTILIQGCYNECNETEAQTGQPLQVRFQAPISLFSYFPIPIHIIFLDGLCKCAVRFLSSGIVTKGSTGEHCGSPVLLFCLNYSSPFSALTAATTSSSRFEGSGS